MNPTGIESSSEMRRRKARNADAALRLKQVSVWLTDGGKGDEPPLTGLVLADPAVRGPRTLSATLFPTVLKLRM